MWMSEHGGTTAAADKVLKQLFGQIFRSPGSRVKGSPSYLRSVDLLHQRLGM
jgi:hypothetical protein